MSTQTISTLFDLSAEWIQLLEVIEANDGVLTEETEKAFTSLALVLGAKVDAYGSLITTLELQAVGYKDRVKAFTAAQRARERTVERLKQRLLDAMQMMGSRKIIGDTYTARIGESEAVKVEDPASIPADFWRQPSPEIDRSAIKKALSDGKTVPGASLEIRPYVVLR